MKRFLVRWSKRALIVAVVLALVFVAWIAFTRRVQTTAAGVPVRWLLPLSPDGKNLTAVPILASSSQSMHIPGFVDGPVVEQGAAGWKARWFCEDRTQQATGTSGVLQFQCGDILHVYSLAPSAIPAAVQPMPERLFVLSDLEGDPRFLDTALRELGLSDDAGHWAGTDAQLVILGDSVDRGRGVFEVLWRLRTLQQEAAAAGGAVHVLIGNHEQYVLRGIRKSLHPEHRYGLARMGGQSAAFAKGTVIGDWLRQLPVAVRLGDTLFVHAGLSLATTRALPGPEAANAAMRHYWALPSLKSAAHIPQLDAVLETSGLTQFRGLLRKSEKGTTTPQAELDAALNAWQAGRLVIGHSVVPEVKAVYAGRVWAVDVADEELAQAALTFVQGEPKVVPLRARRQANDLGFKVRRASEVDESGLLSGTVGEIREAMGIPMPY